MSTTVQNIIKQAVSSCDELITLLNKENDVLMGKNLEQIEAISVEKEHVSKRLDDLIANIKVWSETASEEDKIAIKEKANILHDKLAVINPIAQRNFNLLEASHVATRDFLNIVRKSISKPKAATYGNSGVMENEDSDANLVTKSV